MWLHLIYKKVFNIYSINIQNYFLKFFHYSKYKLFEKIDQLSSQFFINKSLYIKSIDLVKNQKLLKYIYIYKIKRIRPMQSVY